ncbi:uncharacterized protein zgc:66455 isoform X2 [Stegostoma tigrinum]|uniref:uncharacterized protein zgc:66455 isoform X2 n=1 Tax=Stegostoma tigrinum TaxID=3053191 RepID=UPI00202B46AE|nr:uncharacterized protein zgc:66455 isoform X2 [Stegostoma tigrinum]
MGPLMLSNFSMLLVFFVIFHTLAADPRILWTGGEVTALESGKKSQRERTEKSRQDVVHVLSDPSKTYPGGYLFQVTFGVKFEGDNFKEFEGFERRVARSIENLVKHKFSTFSPSLKKLHLHSTERIDAAVLFLTYWLYFNPGGQDIRGQLETRLNQLKARRVANLRHGKATLFFKSVEDVDECSSGLSMCDPRADCFNAFGFYSCQCIEGFEDHSLNGSGIDCVKNEKSGGPMRSLGHLHVKHQHQKPELSPGLLPPASFKRFQQMDMVHETWQRIHTKNLFQAEAAELALQQHPGREQPTTNSQLIPELAALATGSKSLSIKHQAAGLSHIHLGNTAGPQGPYTANPQRLFTAVHFTTLSGIVRPSQAQPHLPGPSPLKPARSLQMSTATSEWLNPQVQHNGDIPQPSRIKRNPVICKFDKLGHSAPFQWQISYSAASSGFWSLPVSPFLGEVNPTGNFFPTDTLLKPRVENYSRSRVKLSSNSDPRNDISNSKHLAINPVNNNIIPRTTQPVQTPQRKYWGSSVCSDAMITSLLNWLLPTEEQGEKQNVGVRSEDSEVFIGNVDTPSLHMQRTHLLEISSSSHIPNEIKHRVLCDPKNATGPGNDKMSESALTCLDGMLLTPSLYSDLGTMPESQNLYSDGFFQTAHQTHEMELQVIIPTHVDITSRANSTVVTGREPLIYGGDQRTNSVWSSSLLLAAQWAVEVTTNQIDGTSLLEAAYPVDPSTTILQTPTWTTVAPKLHEDIGHLLAVSIGIELVNVVYKNLQHLKRRLLQSVKAVLTDTLASFSPPLKKILLQGVQRINSSGFAFDYELYFGVNGENISHSLQIRLNKLLNKSVVNLRNGRVYLSWVLVGDVDECQSEIGACSKEAKCLNTVGSYFCQCEGDFEDRSLGHSRVCIDPSESDPSFWSSFGLQETLIGSAICAFLLTAMMLILCFVVYKRSQNKYFRACDLNLGVVPTRVPLSLSDELVSEESLFTVPHRVSSYISFTKFQPIPEDSNGQEIDYEMTNPYEMKPQPAFKTFHL